MMTIFILLLVTLFALLYFSAKGLERKNRRLQERFRQSSEEQFRQIQEANSFRITLADKLIEMRESPLTTYADWKEILPVCEYADEFYDRTHQCQSLIRLATFVRSSLRTRK